MMPTANPWPIDDARHNVWQLCRELANLEGHLDDPGRNCVKCITKHLACIEGLAQEGIGLDHSAALQPLFRQVIDAVASAGWAPGVPPEAARELIRQARRACCTAQLRNAGAPNILPRRS
ncbi:MAG: hypothetical protein H6747_08965 [Deltaproteobacteria bacterium]|nr:hypothetical protein [Deltaproteobacteria bacterium]